VQYAVSGKALAAGNRQCKLPAASAQWHLLCVHSPVFRRKSAQRSVRILPEGGTTNEQDRQSKDRSINKCQISRTWCPVFRPNGTTLCQPRATPWEIFHAMISSPNGQRREGFYPVKAFCFNSLSFFFSAAFSSLIFGSPSGFLSGLERR